VTVYSAFESDCYALQVYSRTATHLSAVMEKTDIEVPDFLQLGPLFGRKLSNRKLRAACSG